jgi:transposase
MLYSVKRRGLRNTEILVERSEEKEASQSTATKLWALYRKTGSHKPRPNLNGRKPVLSAERLEGIRRKIGEQPDLGLRELIEEFSLPVSVPALCKTIHRKPGLRGKRRRTRRNRSGQA